MKRTFLYAMLLSVPIANAQTPTAEWYAKRFGANAVVPPASMHQRWNAYKNLGYNDIDATARYNNSKGTMLATGIAKTGVSRSGTDSQCRAWQHLYEVTDLLPANTWVRASANLGDHYPLPDSAVKPLEMERATVGVMDRLMFRGNNIQNSLNVLWNVIPVVWPHSARSDVWNNIKTSPYGMTQVQAISGIEPNQRDWYRPAKEYLPFLKSQFQEFVYWVNNAAAMKVRALTPSNDPVTIDITQKIGFQLGNEPGGGRPGGSSFAQVGSWKGLGEVMEGTSAGLEYKPTASLVQLLNLPSSFGSNPLTLPSFSYLTEGPTLRNSHMEGKTRAFQESGALTPGLNEIASYRAEMDGKTWATQCGRRGVHFRSPAYRWKFHSNDFGNLNAIDASMLFYGPGDVTWGRWETPEEYAKRWVIELEKTVELVGTLPMPTASTVVDVTECYVTSGEMGISFVDSAVTLPNGNKIDFTQHSLDSIRNIGRMYTKVGSTLVERTAGQIPPKRADVLVAIRNELYRRDEISKDLSKYLGKIYWWGVYNPDPRFETGIVADTTGNANYYHPYLDFRFNLEEVKALWGISN